ncbi:MAG: hypothetical protein II075_12150 [Bacteroidales bacterium]|nr:hypothetical protein [Bacteroidales bacterium]
MDKEQLQTIGNDLRRYTMDEINAMLDQAEARFAEGKYVTNEEVFRKWNEHIANRKLHKSQEEQYEMAIAV